MAHYKYDKRIHNIKSEVSWLFDSLIFQYFLFEKTDNIFYFFQSSRFEFISYYLILTDGAKVLAQNTCLFFSNSETTSESQKQLVRLRIFRSFRIWVQKFCVSFC